MKIKNLRIYSTTTTPNPHPPPNLKGRVVRKNIETTRPPGDLLKRCGPPLP